MSMLWPDKIEKPLESIVADVQKAAAQAPALTTEVRALVADIRAEVAEWKKIRERLFTP